MSDGPTGTTFVWHIDRAKFVFENADEYEIWKKTKPVFFEMDPSMSDDGGEEIFEDAEAAAADFEINEDNGTLSISLEEDGPLITAWVKWVPNLADGIEPDEVIEWSQDMAGWSAGSIHLGDVDATISEDDGGDIRLLEG